LRLESPAAKRAMECGGVRAPRIRDKEASWVAFELFRRGYPDVDLLFWAREAYRFAREGPETA